MPCDLLDARSLHSIVQIPIQEGPIGAGLPLLFIEGGSYSRLALAWARSKSLEDGASSATVADGIKAFGRFLDYCGLIYDSKVSGQKQLKYALKKFHQARRFGCPELAWKAVRAPTAAKDVRLVSELADWAADNFSAAPLNPLEENFYEDLTQSEQHSLGRFLAGKQQWSFFAHLTAATKLGQGRIRKRDFTPPNKRHKSGSVKYFPAHKADSFITETPNIRDRLYFLLLLYGSPRISEPLHIYTRDVTIRPDGVARIVLAHPQDGSFEWIDAAQRRRTGKRIDYLAERYGIGPRHLLPEGHPLHAGWKGMLFENEKRQESEVHWIDDSKGRLFAEYHLEYVKSFRGRINDEHPFYFVNTRLDDHYGKPLKMSNIEKSFKRAAARVGLSEYDDGVNPHGGRHFYGMYCASVLGLPIEITQRLMHHEHVSSTEKYYALTDVVVRDALRSAKVKRELPADIEAIMRER